ncbi:MAG: TlpA family protein disulfide reductase [Chromatiaceae bacterium]|nr:TlpA family protein disulfide reductase [Chromatiaceae bacterium]MCP5422575.1 TlpA family protein disulfide reductase [Chromatiaceae bacterium]
MHAARGNATLPRRRTHCRHTLLAFLLVLFCTAPAVSDDAAFELDNGDAITYERFGAGGTGRVLLLPADEGFTDTEIAFAKGLAAQGLEVIYPHLHDSYFLTPGAFSLAAVPLDDLVGFVAHVDDAAVPLYLIANQRVAVIALEVAAAYQRRVPGRRPVGMVLLSPYLEATALQPGQPMRFHPAAMRSNLPLFLLQPASSSRAYLVPDTVAALERGGSPVFTRIEPDTRDAYHIWPEEITPYERERRQSLPAQIAQVLPLLAASEPAPLAEDYAGDRQARRNVVNALPQPIDDAPAAPALRLDDLDGRSWSTGDLRGRVVLLNFWATWCPPCIEELPALRRLQQRLSEADFSVVSVDVGEDRETVEAFLRSNGIELGYPVLIDGDAATVKDWNITGFPTSFVVDRVGRLRFGLIGAIAWDGDEVVALLRELLSE